MNATDERYRRQVLVAELGEAGQRRLLDARVVIVGCGALGSNHASLLVRAGVGELRLIDRDRIERSNLARQVLYDERDVAAGRHKAEAAAHRLRAIHGEVRLDPRVATFDAGTARALIDGADVVLDGTDNFETRYVLNDACVEAGVPWIYGGVIATSGMVLPVRPGEGPCLRCLFPVPPAPGSVPSTAELGVINTAPALIAALQVTELIKLLVDPDAVSRRLLHVELWHRAIHELEVAREPACPCCVGREFSHLHPLPD